jgi:hypothetical protein
LLAVRVDVLGWRYDAVRDVQSDSIAVYVKAATVGGCGA